MKVWTRSLVLVALAIPAYADEPDFSAVSSRKVDLDSVVALGTVAPVDGVTSAGQPDEAALEVFADAGYVAVIDLRGPGEERGFDEASVVEDLGMHYASLPVAGQAAVTFGNARKLDELLTQFDGPVLVHCGSGNRVGALLALRASLEGADDATAMQVGRDAGLTRLEETVQERLKAGAE